MTATTTPSSTAIDAGLRSVLAAIEAWIGPGLAACPLPAGLDALAGSHADAALRLDTRRWRGGGFSALTVATIRDVTGRLCSVTIIGLPAAGELGPIVGLDLIGLGGALSLIAVDLAPTDHDTWAACAVAPLTALHAAVAPHVVPRRWPSFAEEVFSPHALIAGVRRGAELEALCAVADFVARARPLATTAAEPERAAAASARVAAWCRAELQNRRENVALTRIFGADPAAAYLDLLFGTTAASAA